MANTLASASAPLRLYEPFHREAIRKLNWMSAFAREVLGFRRDDPAVAHIAPHVWQEISAWIQLIAWKLEGVYDHVHMPLPDMVEAGQDLLHRIMNQPASFDAPGGRPLTWKVLGVWLVGFAWESGLAVEGDTVLGMVDEDSFVDAMAQFLWANRHLNSIRESP